MLPLLIVGGLVSLLLWSRTQGQATQTGGGRVPRQQVSSTARWGYRQQAAEQTWQKQTVSKSSGPDQDLVKADSSTLSNLEYQMQITAERAAQTSDPDWKMRWEHAWFLLYQQYQRLVGGEIPDQLYGSTPFLDGDVSDVASSFARTEASYQDRFTRRTGGINSNGRATKWAGARGPMPSRKIVNDYSGTRIPTWTNAGMAWDYVEHPSKGDQTLANGQGGIMPLEPQALLPANVPDANPPAVVGPGETRYVGSGNLVMKVKFPGPARLASDI